MVEHLVYLGLEVASYMLGKSFATELLSQHLKVLWGIRCRLEILFSVRMEHKVCNGSFEEYLRWFLSTEYMAEPASFSLLSRPNDCSLRS